MNIMFKYHMQTNKQKKLFPQEEKEKGAKVTHKSVP